jgi:hypothetical protein
MDLKVYRQWEENVAWISNFSKGIRKPNKTETITLSQHFLSQISVPTQCLAEVTWDLQTSLAAVQNPHMKMSF